jgi:hypothetical protein
MPTYPAFSKRSSHGTKHPSYLSNNWREAPDSNNFSADHFASAASAASAARLARHSNTDHLYKSRVHHAAEQWFLARKLVPKQKMIYDDCQLDLIIPSYDDFLYNEPLE